LSKVVGIAGDPEIGIAVEWVTCIHSLPHVLIEGKKVCGGTKSENFSFQSMIPNKVGSGFREKIMLKTK